MFGLAIAVVAGLGLPVGADIRLPPSWPQIQARGYLRVAVRQDASPLSTAEKKLAQRLASILLGRAEAVQWVPVANGDRLAAVTAGQADMAIAQISVTGSRARLVDFSEPYFTEETVLIGRAGRGQSQLRRVAVLKGSSAIVALQQFLPHAERLGVDSYTAAQQALAQGQVDGVAGDRQAWGPWLAAHPQWEVWGAPLATWPMAIALPKGLQHSEWRSHVRQALANLRQQGEIPVIPTADIEYDKKPDFTSLVRPSGLDFSSTGER
ncbi:MAG: transporter substrate-binding domain-containing protein [Pseudanabaenaceae cyanobacterium]